MNILDKGSLYFEFWKQKFDCYVSGIVVLTSSELECRVSRVLQCHNF